MPTALPVFGASQGRLESVPPFSGKQSTRCALQVELGPLPQELRLQAVDAVLAWQDHRSDLEAEVWDDVEETKIRVRPRAGSLGPGAVQP